MSTVPAAWMPAAKLERIIFHWTAGTHRASAFDKAHYHILIEADGKVVRGTPTIDGNGKGSTRGKRASHTLNCNTGSIGVSVCCMGGNDVRENPFAAGKYPLTRAQWDKLALVLADLCRTYGIPVTPTTVLSHAEVQGNLGIKQRQKWDISRLAFDPAVKGAKACGDLMRRKVKEAMSPVAVASLMPEPGGDLDEDGEPEDPVLAEAPVVPPPPFDLVSGDPELWHIQRRLKAMNYSPGGVDGRWGGMTAGAVSGFINDRNMGIGAPTSVEMFREVQETIKAELARAEAEAFRRPVAIDRSTADARKVEQAAPEVVPVKRNFLVTAWAAVVTFVTGIVNSLSGYIQDAWAFFADHKDDLPGDSGLLSTASDYLGRVPAIVWFGLAAAGIAFVAFNSWRGVQRITQSVQTGERQ